MKHTSADPDYHNGSLIFETRFWKHLAAYLAIAVMTAMLQGCKTSGGTIQGITGQQASSGTGGPARFFLQGQGVCDKVSFDFGDGSPVLEVANYDFSNLPLVQHSYTGWGGGHTVRAGSVQNCVGQAEMIFTTGQSVFTVGFAPSTTCANISGLLSKPNLRTNTKVQMKTNPDPNVKINFGCAFNACIYDANGSNTVASSPFPFPGMKEFSMVMRVGTQIVQGGTNVTFTTNQAGPLEVCVNDNVLTNNTGAWGLIIDVDESKAP